MGFGSSSSADRRDERGFGFLLGGLLAAFAVWGWYRGKFPTVTPWLIVAGIVLIVVGAALPGLLAWPYRMWMGLAEGLSFVMTRLMLALVFFLTLMPVGVIKRLTGWDPLRRRAARAASYWRPYPERQRDPRHYEKMY